MPRSPFAIAPLSVYVYRQLRRNSTGDLLETYRAKVGAHPLGDMPCKEVVAALFPKGFGFHSRKSPSTD